MKTIPTSGIYHDQPAFPLIKFAQITQGLIYSGTVTAVPGANQFTIPDLAGLGAGIFDGATNPYRAFVIRDAGGASAAPQGEVQAITAYVTATGAFTTGAFTAAVAVGDEVAIVHPSIAGILDLTTSSARQVFPMEFWSVPIVSISVTNGATDISLPDVTVADLPAGATIIRAIAMFKFRIVRETSAGANALSGAQEIQVRDDSPSAWIDAINFADNQFTLAASAEEGGDVFVGAIDISGTVDGNDTYNFQWDEAIADATGITFSEIQTGIKIWFTV